MNHREDRSFAYLLSEATREVGALIRKEVELARAEVGEKISQASSGVTSIAVGGVVLLVAAHALVAAAILGLALYVEPWLSALIVGAVLLVVGLAVLMRGLANVKADSLKPRRTITTLRENASWARGQLP